MEDPGRSNIRGLRFLIFFWVAIILEIIFLVALHYLVTHLSLDIVKVDDYADRTN